MKAVCKKCQTNGIHGGMEGATSSSECPSKYITIIYVEESDYYIDKYSNLIIVLRLKYF